MLASVFGVRSSCPKSTAARSSARLVVVERCVGARSSTPERHRCSRSHPIRVLLRWERRSPAVPLFGAVCYVVRFGRCGPYAVPRLLGVVLLGLPRVRIGMCGSEFCRYLCSASRHRQRLSHVWHSYVHDEWGSKRIKPLAFHM